MDPLFFGTKFQNLSRIEVVQRSQMVGQFGQRVIPVTSAIFRGASNHSKHTPQLMIGDCSYVINGFTSELLIFTGDLAILVKQSKPHICKYVTDGATKWYTTLGTLHACPSKLHICQAVLTEEVPILALADCGFASVWAHISNSAVTYGTLQSFQQEKFVFQIIPSPSGEVLSTLSRDMVGRGFMLPNQHL